MLNGGLGGGRVVEDGGDEGEVGDGVSGGDNYGMHCLIKLNTLLREMQSCSSSPASVGEIKGLFLNPSITL